MLTGAADRRRAGVTAPPGVGARQAFPTPPRPGGGYQDICVDFEFEGRDPRFVEITKMGMPKIWIEVAAAIGMDAFLCMWRTLDGNLDRRVGSMLEFSIRPYRSYLRYQRNRYIETLVQSRVPLNEISARVSAQLCEPISRSHITKILKKSRGAA